MIYINNETSQTEIEWAEDLIDLTKPLSGRIELSVKLKIGPSKIPPKNVSLMVLGGNGDVAYKSMDTNFNEKMNIGFRTNKLKNGNYKIYFIAEIFDRGKASYISTSLIPVSIYNK